MKGKTLGGIFLVSGTTIGAGMLALPLMTGVAGFLPALALFTICWLFSIYTGFLTLEVDLWFKEEVNLISMARRTLGKGGEVATWVIYLFFLYCLSAAYITAGGSFTHEFFQLLGINLPDSVKPLPFLILFGAIILKETQTIDFINRILMIGLIITYVLIMSFIAPHGTADFFQDTKPKFLWAAVPLVMASFGFHMVLPSLTHYLKRDVRRIKQAIVIGSLIPLVVYALWEAAILSILPYPDLVDAYRREIPVAHILSEAVKNPLLLRTVHLFSFFAIVTSFLGVGWSLVKFLKDGLKRHGKPGLVSLIAFAPPLAFALLFPQGFVLALSYAGVFVALLEGALPAIMALKGRKIHPRAPYRVFGGNKALMLTLLLSLMVMILQIAFNAGYLPSP